MLLGGFVLDGVEQKPDYAVLVAHRFDEFGVSHRYCFAISDEEIGPSSIEGASVAAKHYGADLIVIGNCNAEGSSLDWAEFVNLLGGPVFGLSPLEAQFEEYLEQLGHNQLPEGFEGKADNLFEKCVRSALEFSIGSQVVPYGQNRRFEARPDGIIPPDQGFYALYDAKAYKDGYDVTRDTTRQFQDYVEDFLGRYRGYLPRLNAFVVVSGHFRQTEHALAERSRDLYDLCGVPLSFLTTDSLSKIIKILADNPRIRRAIRWSRIFADPIVRPDRVEQERLTVLRDEMIS